MFLRPLLIIDIVNGRTKQTPAPMADAKTDETPMPTSSSRSLWTQEELSKKPDFETVKTMLALSLLVYDQGLEDGLAKIDEVPEEKQGNTWWREARDQLLKVSPNGSVISTITRQASGLDCAITLSPEMNRITVIFRGTKGLQDVIVDTGFFKVYDSHIDARVHKGFYYQLHDNRAMEIIEEGVRTLLTQNRDYSVWVTGHSLGGALSSLCALELAVRIGSDFPTTKVYNCSFASPRVGDTQWRDNFHAQPNLYHIRVANSGDPVTAVPSINYSHVGTWVIVIKETAPATFYPPPPSYPWYSTFALWNNLRVGTHGTEAYWNNFNTCAWTD